MRTVQLRHANARLSELVEAAKNGEPTLLTKHGHPAAMVIPIDDGRKLYPDKKPNLVEWLMSMPADIPFERDQTPPRVIEFEK